jgi:IS5 family transposase
MDRNHLKGRAGDAANALLAAIGYNFRLLIAWITLLWPSSRTSPHQTQKSNSPEIKVLHRRQLLFVNKKK